ncbi:GyrI-like domain-containing protein [Gottschalkiaceae bacterium SANA]|nr:GyrI-like domain-containing protein [Gottschalkiaceae bacterium SANA]
MKDKFLIGELAKMFNITTDTLRHYEKKNLLKPEHDSENSYRYYDLDSMFKLGRILFLKNLGISLGEIDDYMENKNADKLFEMLKKKNEEVDLRIQQLTNLKHKINSKLELFEYAKTKLGQITVTTLQARRGIFLETYGLEDSVEIKEIFKKSENFLKMSSWLVEGEVYTSLAKCDMEKGIFNQFRYFIEIESADQTTDAQLILQPASTYACLTVIGPYENLAKHYQTLVDWIADNNYKIAGDSFEYNIVDNDYSDSSDEFITEIQIPIKMK